jgi:hypothetical protein
LKHGEVRGAVGCRDHDLAVDDGRGGVDKKRVVGDLLIAFGPIVAPTGEYPEVFVHHVQLDAVAVEFDFVDPSVSVRRLLD